jgi:hypothetical protein
MFRTQKFKASSNHHLNFDIFLATVKAGHISVGQRFGDSNNPIYNSSDNKHSAQSNCALYDVTEPEPEYHYANPAQEIETQRAPEETYDYALPDGNSRNAKVAQQNASELDNSQDTMHLYHVLEHN